MGRGGWRRGHWCFCMWTNNLHTSKDNLYMLFKQIKKNHLKMFFGNHLKILQSNCMEYWRKQHSPYTTFMHIAFQLVLTVSKKPENSFYAFDWDGNWCTVCLKKVKWPYSGNYDMAYQKFTCEFPGGHFKEIGIHSQDRLRWRHH